MAGGATKLLSACSSFPRPLSPEDSRQETKTGRKKRSPRAPLTALGYLAPLELAPFTALLDRDKATNVNINQTSPGRDELSIQPVYCFYRDRDRHASIEVELTTMHMCQNRHH